MFQEPWQRRRSRSFSSPVAIGETTLIVRMVLITVAIATVWTVSTNDMALFGGTNYRVEAATTPGNIMNHHRLYHGHPELHRQQQQRDGPRKESRRRLREVHSKVLSSREPSNFESSDSVESTIEQQHRNTQGQLFPEDFWYLWTRGDGGTYKPPEEGAAASAIPVHCQRYYWYKKQKGDKKKDGKSEKKDKSTKKIDRMVARVRDVHNLDRRELGIGTAVLETECPEGYYYEEPPSKVPNSLPSSPGAASAPPPTPSPVFGGRTPTTSGSNTSNRTPSPLAIVPTTPTPVPTKLQYVTIPEPSSAAASNPASGGGKSKSPKSESSGSGSDGGSVFDGKPSPWQDDGAPWLDETSPNGDSSSSSSSDESQGDIEDGMQPPDDNDFIIIVVDNSSKGDEDGQANGSSNSNGTPNDSGSQTGSQTEDPESPTGGSQTDGRIPDDQNDGTTNNESSNNKVCDSIANQDHTEILARQENGTSGPSLLYSVQVSVQHEPALANTDRVIEALGTMNVPIALSVSGCDDNEDGQRNRKTSERIPRDLLFLADGTDASIPDVEYVEVETWKAEEEGCGSDGDTTDGNSESIVCGAFGSRVIIFFPTNNNRRILQSSSSSSSSSDVETVFRNRIYGSILAHDSLVTSIPGVDSLTIQSIEILEASDGEGLSADGVQTETTSRMSVASNPIAIVGSVAAGLGGLLFGMMLIVWWKRSSPKIRDGSMHSRFDDASEDYYWPKGDGLMPATREAIPLVPTVSLTPTQNQNTSFDTSNNSIDTSNNSIAAEATRRSYRGNHLNLNRVDSLLDQPNGTPQYNKTPSPLSPKSFKVSSPEWGIAPTLSTEGSSDDLNFEDFNNDEVQQPFACRAVPEIPIACGAIPSMGGYSHPPCSSPTCPKCEVQRSRGIRHSEQLWLELLAPPGPQKIPSDDPNRAWFCSDTVQL